MIRIFLLLIFLKALLIKCESTLLILKNGNSAEELVHSNSIMTNGKILSLTFKTIDGENPKHFHNRGVRKIKTKNLRSDKLERRFHSGSRWKRAQFNEDYTYDEDPGNYATSFEHPELPPWVDTTTKDPDIFEYGHGKKGSWTVRYVGIGLAVGIVVALLIYYAIKKFSNKDMHLHRLSRRHGDRDVNPPLACTMVPLNPTIAIPLRPLSAPVQRNVNAGSNVSSYYIAPADKRDNTQANHLNVHHSPVTSNYLHNSQQPLYNSAWANVTPSAANRN